MQILSIPVAHVHEPFEALHLTVEYSSTINCEKVSFESHSELRFVLADYVGDLGFISTDEPMPEATTPLTKYQPADLEGVNSANLEFYPGEFIFREKHFCGLLVLRGPIYARDHVLGCKVNAKLQYYQIKSNDQDPEPMQMLADSQLSGYTVQTPLPIVYILDKRDMTNMLWSQKPSQDTKTLSALLLVYPGILSMIQHEIRIVKTWTIASSGISAGMLNNASATMVDMSFLTALGFSLFGPHFRNDASAAVQIGRRTVATCAAMNIPFENLGPFEDYKAQTNWKSTTPSPLVSAALGYAIARNKEIQESQKSQSYSRSQSTLQRCGGKRRCISKCRH
jgi:hypothetical protein